MYSVQLPRTLSAFIARVDKVSCCMGGIRGLSSLIQTSSVGQGENPNIPRVVQDALDSAGVTSCPTHGVDHLSTDPSCDHCKRALGTMY